VSWSRVRPPVRRQLPRNRACTLRYFPLLLWMWYAIIWSKLEACRFKSCGRIEVLHAACPAVRRQRSCCLVARAMCTRHTAEREGGAASQFHARVTREQQAFRRASRESSKHSAVRRHARAASIPPCVRPPNQHHSGGRGPAVTRTPTTPTRRAMAIKCDGYEEAVELKECVVN